MALLPDPLNTPHLQSRGGAVAASLGRTDTDTIDPVTGTIDDAAERRAATSGTNASTLNQHLTTLGEHIRSTRKSYAMSIQELAEQTGISSAMISLVERGRAVPSLGTLVAVASELRISLGDLFAGEEGSAPEAVTRVGSQRVLRMGERITRTVIIENFAEGFRLSKDEWLPGAKSEPELARHPGFEVGYVLKGELSVDLEDATYVLKPGDVVSYASTKLHRIDNLSSKPAVAIWLNIFQRWAPRSSEQ